MPAKPQPLPESKGSGWLTCLGVLATFLCFVLGSAFGIALSPGPARTAGWIAFALSLGAVGVGWRLNMRRIEREKGYAEALDQWQRSVGPPTGDVWRRMFEAEGLAGRIAEVESRVRLAVCASSIARQPKLGASQLGGEPSVPAGFVWPTMSDGRPLHFAAQIALDRIRPVVPLLPKAGLLQFFYREDEGAVFYYPAGVELVPAPPPAGAAWNDAPEDEEMRLIAQGRTLRFRQVEDIPDLGDATDDIRDYLGQGEVKLLGYAHCWEDVDKGSYIDPEAEILLLQLSNVEEIAGESGVFYLIQPSDLRNSDFSRVRCVSYQT